MIECMICGHNAKSRLIEHIIRKHNMTVKDYKKIYAAKVITEDYKNQVSARSKKTWSDPKHKEMMKKSQDKAWENPERKLKISNTLREKYKRGEINKWNKGLTKETDERLASIGSKNKEHLTGRRKEEYQYLQNMSDRLKAKCLNGNIDLNKWRSDKEKVEKSKQKISETLSRRIANGEITYKSNRFKTGWYINDNGKHWYSSQLEKDIMIYFDTLDIIESWTNVHGIVIPYIDEYNVKRRYVPDFKVVLTSGEILIIEGKGWETEEVKLKTSAANKYTKNYIIIYSVEELEEKLCVYKKLNQ